MAANCARRTLQFSSASAKTLLSRPPSSPFASKASKLTELTSLKPASAPRLAAQKLKFSRFVLVASGGVGRCAVVDPVAQCYRFCLVDVAPVFAQHQLGVPIRRFRYSTIAWPELFLDCSYDDLTFCMSSFEILKTRDRE
ncbi:hypothetical protein DVH24_007024 [Malus domestica]|uniref:Uncharacterized protein n=1 Tax=Malus domestica TaxID=3750 RepID=A0A498HE80_MALDO|nr:hypothetical protein DVH24_007024 [Malus domestica]